MQPTTFYIVRHAQSHGNIKKIISGQIETSLSDEGILQAKSRAQEFKSVHFDAVFSSDLMRANQTACIIAKEHALTVAALAVLRERHFGDLEGKRYDELEDTLREQFDAYNAMVYKERFSQRLVDGMETDEEVMGRFIAFIRETAIAYMGKTVLIVCHGNIMRTFLVHLGFGTLAELPPKAIENTGYFVLQSDGVEFEVVKTVGIEKKQA